MLVVGQGNNNSMWEMCLQWLMFSAEANPEANINGYGEMHEYNTALSILNNYLLQFMTKGVNTCGRIE